MKQWTVYRKDHAVVIEADGWELTESGALMFFLIKGERMNIRDIPIVFAPGNWCVVEEKQEEVKE